MTFDAKIGLLLGLVFIFVIAFIINGLPSFSSDTTGNELTGNMVDAQQRPLALGQKERRVRESLALAESVRPPSPTQAANISEMTENVRFTMPLPKTTSPAKEPDETQTTVVKHSGAETKKDNTSSDKSGDSISPKTCVVQRGDSLACIAQRFYGAEQGNKIININRIFKANRKILKSPHEIQVGQELLIPPLQGKINKVRKM